MWTSALTPTPLPPAGEGLKGFPAGAETQTPFSPPGRRAGDEGAAGTLPFDPGADQSNQQDDTPCTQPFP